MRSFAPGLLATALLCLIAAPGCATPQIILPSLETTPDQSQEELHYLVLRNRTLYDCYSKPEGQWKPECRKVKLTGNAGR